MLAAFRTNTNIFENVWYTWVVPNGYGVIPTVWYTVVGVPNRSASTLMAKYTGGMHRALIVGWDDDMTITVRAERSGELVTVDLPSVLHEYGLLTRLFQTNDKKHTLRINHSTGRYMAVTTHESGGYTARINKHTTIRGANARTVASHRASMRRRKPSDGENGAEANDGDGIADAADNVVHGIANDTVDDECEFLHERTWAQRDAEGRAAAVNLDDDGSTFSTCA